MLKASRLSGEVSPDWGDAKRAQKDVDGRWTGKRGKKYFGYKNHLSIDAKHKLMRRFETTPAKVHDSRVFDDLIDPDNVDPGVWADSAYRSQETEKVLQDAGYESEKGQRNQPLTDEQQANNRTRAKIRSRVEHVFGFQENSMGGKFIRTIGLARAKLKIGLMNLTYNLMRYLQLTKGRESTLAIA